MTHMFELQCKKNVIEQRLTKIKHRWTNGQVERMNRTIEEATVKRYHYDNHQQFEAQTTTSSGHTMVPDASKVIYL